MPALIHQAIVDGRIHQLRLLVRIGADLNTREERYGRTPIITASLLDNEDLAVAICQILIKHRCDCNSKDSTGRTALAHVASLGREKIALYLLEDINIDLSATDNDGNTPLILACQSGNTVIVATMVKKMYQANIHVNTRNKDGFTAILMAAKHGHRYCEQILRREGQALVDIRDNIMFYNVDDWLNWYDQQHPTSRGNYTSNSNGKNSNGKHASELHRQSSFRRTAADKNSIGKRNNDDNNRKTNDLLPKIEVSRKPPSSRSRSSSQGKKDSNGKQNHSANCDNNKLDNITLSNQHNRSPTPTGVYHKPNPPEMNEFYSPPSSSRQTSKKKAIDLNTLLSIYGSNNNTISR